MLHPAPSDIGVVGRAGISMALHRTCRCGPKRGALGDVLAMDKDIIIFLQ